MLIFRGSYANDPGKYVWVMHEDDRVFPMFLRDDMFDKMEIKEEIIDEETGKPVYRTLEISSEDLAK